MRTRQLTTHPRLRHGLGLLRAGLPLLPMTLIAIVLFLWAYHPAMLDPTQLGRVLRGGDNGENALGMHAFLHQADGPWHTPLLNAPDGVSLLFTDSNPLLGILPWVVSPLLPGDAQFAGP